MVNLRRLTVIALESACSTWDRIPLLRRLSGCRLARLSLTLDDRWATRVWYTEEP